MTAMTPSPAANLRRSGGSPRVPTPVRTLQVFCAALFVLPSFTVFKPIGAAAFPAGLVALGAMGLWGVWTILGMHDPLGVRTPVRAAFGIIWVVSLLAYLSLQFRGRSAEEVLGGDRWLLYLAGITGVALVASECLQSLDQLKIVLRTLTGAASFCAVVAVIQYFFFYDLTPVLGRVLPGFTFAEGLGGIQFRAGLNRVPGTTLHPIELGTTAAMMLPIATYMAMYDTAVSWRRRLLPAVIIGACIPLSVSRSAVLALVASMVVFVVGLPPKQRVVGLAMMPVAVGMVFLTLRGTISTLVGYFSFVGQDPSVSTRTDDYGLVEDLVRQRPWFGQGGGTYQPTDLLTILDNQYLKWAIEFGMIGVVGLVLFFSIPAATAFMARKRGAPPELKVLNGALGAAIVSAAVSSATFDAFSFPVFSGVLALFIGLVGTCWRLAEVRSSWARREAG